MLERPNIALPLLFVEDLEAPILEKNDRHHFERVLRVKFGDRINISDGNGSWRECNFGQELTDFGEIYLLEEPKVLLGVGFCPLKGGRSDSVVAKLTELGVDYMRPFYAERSVVRFGVEKTKSQMDRWKRIVREAGMQSRRARLPHIQYPVDFEEIAQTPNVSRCDIAGDKPVFDRPSPMPQLLLVGPEGGWTEAERESIKETICLGPNVLRSDTAALVAAAKLLEFRGY